MTDLDWREQSDPARCLQALAAHRLSPVAGLLAERGLLRRDLVAPAEQMARRHVETMRQGGVLEAHVLEVLSKKEIPVLMLKGALLARTVYPTPESRLRVDLDILVPEAQFRLAKTTLLSTGLRQVHEEHSGLPITQEAFACNLDGTCHGVDLHWDLTHRSVLKGRLPFDGLWRRRTRLESLPPRIFGLSAPDALLHACGHYFAHFRGQFRPDQWLLDMDLLWRAMDAGEREEVMERASTTGVAGLVAGGLEQARDRFATKIDVEALDQLKERGRNAAASRLLTNPRFSFSEVLQNMRDEPRWRDGVRLFFRTFFPRIAYMRYKYDTYPALALPWLYVKRLSEGVRKSGRN